MKRREAPILICMLDIHGHLILKALVHKEHGSCRLL